MDDTNEQAIAEMEVATESNRGSYTDSHVDVDALIAEHHSMFQDNPEIADDEVIPDEVVLNKEDEELLQKTIEEAHQEIPANSQTILVSEETSRFSGAIWYEEIQEKTITLAGVGGIGSYVGFLLSRMHPQQMYIYDSDVVEAANMSGQLYSTNDIGKPKVKALANMVRNYSNYYEVAEFNERFTMFTAPTDIMICGFDNMDARGIFYSVWKSNVMHKPTEERAKCLFIDGRLAAEEFQILCITGDNEYAMNRYEEEFLFTDEQAEATVCSYKQTTFCANMIASYMVNMFVNFVANECNPLVPRTLPFYTYYNAETLYLKIEE